MRRPGAALAGVCAVVVACDDTVVIAPVIDSPGGDADPFTELDTIQLSIALAGDPDDLISATFRRGEPLELPGAPYGENLVVHMVGRSAGSEVSVGRTCPFAVHPAEDPPRPHLYFARTVKWAQAARPPSPLRSGGTAIRYRDSGIFVGGLDNASAPVVGIDRFDAIAGAFDWVADLVPRFFGNAALLGDGRIVIGGGSDPLDGRPISLLEIVTIDQRRVDVVDAGPLVGLNAGAFTTLSNGKIVSFGGRDAGNVPVRDLVEIAADGSGITLRVLNRAKLVTPRYNHTATALSDDFGAPVLIAGGLDATNAPVDTAELYKPLLEELAPITQFAKMVVPRHSHQAVRLPDGSVLIVGGLDAAGNAVRSIELFSLDRGFREVATLPVTAGITEFSATPLPDGRVLLAGGKNGTNPVNTAFIARLDPLGGDIDIVTTDLLGTARAGHQATLLCDGTVMLTGGTLAAVAAERYNPPSAGRR